MHPPNDNSQDGEQKKTRIKKATKRARILNLWSMGLHQLCLTSRSIHTSNLRPFDLALQVVTPRAEESCLMGIAVCLFVCLFFFLVSRFHSA